MPTEENLDAAAGRVTRSLRKRLTSVSSDASSRPGTPIIGNLPSVPETMTPSKRATRRASLNTPLATPSKIKIHLENVDSPARRSTRRRSVSILEQEDHVFQTKSKEPTILAVPEEETAERTPEVKSRRLTRSSSKSPLELFSKSLSKTSVPETSVPEQMQHKKIRKTLKEQGESTPSRAHFKASPKVQSEDRKSTNKLDRPVVVESIITSTVPNGETILQSPAKTQTKPDSSKKLNQIKDTESNTKLDTSQQESAKKRVCVTLFRYKQNSPKDKKNLSDTAPSPVKSQHNCDSSLNKKTLPEKLKNVAFNDTAEENTIKSVFPKTPGLTKTKSFILDSPKDSEHGNSTNLNNQKDSITKSENNSDKCEDEDHDVLNGKTPFKLKLKAVESSTPIQTASPKQSNTIEKEDPEIELLKAKNNEDSATPLFPKSWSHSVSGKVTEKVKIDSIKSEETSRKGFMENEAITAAENRSREKSRSQAFDGSDEDDDMLEEDNDYDEDKDEEEEEYVREKTVFVDDEAMEVPDGEESMDSEERAYLEENEIPEYGESLGSEDSEDDDLDEEADEDDEPFVVSDSEDVNVVFNPEEIVVKEGNRKKYKRILRAVSESSNDEAQLQSTDKNFNDDKKLISKNIVELNSLRMTDDKVNADDEEEQTSNLVLDSKTGNESLSNNVEEDKMQPTKSPNKSRSKPAQSGDDTDLKSPAAKSSDRKSANRISHEEINENDLLSEIESRKSLNENQNTPKRKSLATIETQSAQNKGKTDKNQSSGSLNVTANKFEDFVISDSVDLHVENNSELNSSTPNELDKNNSKKWEAMKLKDGVVKAGEDGIDSDVDSDSEAENTTFSMKLNRSAQVGISDLEADAFKSRKPLNKSKLEIPESDDDADDNIQEAKALKSPNRNSISHEKKRKSENQISDSKINENLSLSNKKSRKSLNENQITTKRKSLTTIDFDTGKSGSKADNNQSRKSLNLTNEDREGINVSRKSLIRTSTEDDQQSSNKITLEKTALSFEDDCEQEETAASIDSSRRRKSVSLNQSKILLEMEDKSDSELADFKKQSMMLRVESSPEVSASEEAEEAESESGDENEDICFSSTEVEDNQKNTAGQSSVLEFLGEDDNQHLSSNANVSRRKSSLNKSNLNETFDLEAGNSISLRDNLHRSIMRKSLNHNQRKATESDEEEGHDTSGDSSADEKVNTQKNVVTKQGLSVSLSNIEFKKKNVKGNGQKIHNSFTIGVSVRTPLACGKARIASSSSNSDESGIDNVLSEQEELEKVQNVHRVGPYNPRNSLSTSLKGITQHPADTNKRTSLGMQEQAASQSFMENIDKEKKKAESKRSKKSNSICGVIAPSEDNNEEKESQLVKGEKQTLKSNDKTNIKRILSRCDEILEAANQAKLNAKLNAKKHKVKKIKGMDNREKGTPAEDEVKIPLVSKKELKRKEKIKKELAKAIKHSTAMLTTIDPKLAKILKINKEPEAEKINSKVDVSKRLPSDFLNTLEDAPPQQKNKKSKEPELTPPTDKENSKKNSNKIARTNPTHEIISEKKKKKHSREIIETTAGTVVVEPSTPVKLKYQNGFRESPKTPAGFKIENVRSAGRNETEKTRKHRTQLFIEEDLSHSTSKVNSKQNKSKKRKLKIDEPLYSLPKTQWTASGVFVEEDLYGLARPLASSTATQFMVTSLYGGNKKTTNSANVISTTTLNSALSFKQNALFNEKVKRESSRELIHRKQRKVANNQY